MTGTAATANGGTGDGGGDGLFSVLIPASNEEGWIGRCLAALMAQDRAAGRLRILEEKERDLREKAEALISKCQTPDEREMLRMRYLMLMDWATIARVLYGDKPGFYDGKMYRQRALMLHKDTMVWLEKGLLTEEKHEDENT